MPIDYKKGDVVLSWYQNDDPKNPGLKKRPVILLEQLSDEEFRGICVTKTDRSQECKGILVPKDSRKGRIMKLREDSFVNLDDIKPVHVRLFVHLLGTCIFMDQIEEVLNS